MDHEAKHTHLGSTSLVQLNGTLLELGLFIKGVPAKVKGTIAEVTREFSSSNVLHDKKFQETNKGQDLKGTGNRDGKGGSPAITKVGELGARVVNVTREVDASLVDKVANNTKHCGVLQGDKRGV